MGAKVGADIEGGTETGDLFADVTVEVLKGDSGIYIYIYILFVYMYM